MRITSQQRAHNEARARAAMDRLLAGDIPPGGSCDIKTLAKQPGVDRSGFYGKRPYTHLRIEFEGRLQQAARSGRTVDPRNAQVSRLKDEIATLERRIAQSDHTIAELTSFKVHALGRLAAQHDEITQLRATLAGRTNIRRLPARAPTPPAGPNGHRTDPPA